MPAEPTLNAEIFHPICESVEKLGGNVNRLLEESHLPSSDDWRNLSGDVSELRVWDFFDRSVRQLQLPQIGLLTGRELQVSDLGTFGRQLEQCLTVHDCLQFYIRKANTHSSHACNWLVPANGGAWFCRHAQEIFNVGRCYVEQFVIELMIRIVQLSAGPQWYPEYVGVECTDNASYRGDDSLDSTEIHFGRNCTAIWISQKTLWAPLSRKNSSKPLLNQIRHSIAENLEQAPRVEMTASSLGFSKRTLQRELALHDLSWRQLIDQVRVDRSIELLTSSDEKIMTIAEQLGYTDSSNLARAFARWTSVSPQAYRDGSLES